MSSFDCGKDNDMRFESGKLGAISSDDIISWQYFNNRSRFDAKFIYLVVSSEVGVQVNSESLHPFLVD